MEDIESKESKRFASLTEVDYVMGVVVMLIPIGIGILYAVKDAKNATRSEYLIGGQHMSVIPVAMSMFAPYQSAISLIGLPSDVYYHGLMVLYFTVGQIMSYIIGYFTIVPLIYPLQITSIYEYLELRFRSKYVRIISVLISMLNSTSYMAIAILSPALALQASAGIPLWVSIVVMGAIGTFRTAIGGIKSIVWTDVFQTFITFIAIFAIITTAIIHVGGTGEVFRLANIGERTKLDEFAPEPWTRHTVWSTTFGLSFMWLVNSFNQATLQRLCCMPTFDKAKVVYLLNIPLCIIYGVAVCSVGLTIYAYFAFHECEPLEAGYITNRNQIAPYYVLHAMDKFPGMAGIFISSLAFGALSTLSSGLNALAANTVEDLLPPLLTRFDESNITFITKLVVVAWGSVIIILTYLAIELEGTVNQMAMSVFGALGMPILSIFILGGTVPCFNKYGAICGAIVSLAFNIWISIGHRTQGINAEDLPSPGVHGCSVWAASHKQTTNTTDAIPNETYPIIFKTIPYNETILEDTFFLYDISYEWYGLIGLLNCSLVGILVSVCTNHLLYHSSQDEIKVSSKFIFPFLRKFWKLEVAPLDNAISTDDAEISDNVITNPNM